MRGSLALNALRRPGVLVLVGACLWIAYGLLHDLLLHRPPQGRCVSAIQYHVSPASPEQLRKLSLAPAPGDQLFDVQVTRADSSRDRFVMAFSQAAQTAKVVRITASRLYPSTLSATRTPAEAIRRYLTDPDLPGCWSDAGLTNTALFAWHSEPRR